MPEQRREIDRPLDAHRGGRRFFAAMPKFPMEIEREMSDERSKLWIVPWSEEQFPASEKALAESEDALDLMREAAGASEPQVVTMTVTDIPAYLFPPMAATKLLKVS